MVTQTGGQPEPGGVVEGATRAAKRTESWEEWWRGPGGKPNALRSEGGVVEGDRMAAKTHTEPGGVVKGAMRAAMITHRAGDLSHGGSQEGSQSHSEPGGVWSGPGGQPNTLRAGRSGGGGQEGSQTLRAGRSGGGGQEGSQTHSEPGGVVEGARRASQTQSEPGGVVEGARRAAKHTQSWEEWWRGPGGQPNALRAGRSGGGGQESSQMHSESGGVVEGYITMTSSQ